MTILAAIFWLFRASGVVFAATVLPFLLLQGPMQVIDSTGHCRVIEPSWNFARVLGLAGAVALLLPYRLLVGRIARSIVVAVLLVCAVWFPAASLQSALNAAYAPSMDIASGALFFWVFCGNLLVALWNVKDG